MGMGNSERHIFGCSGTDAPGQGLMVGGFFASHWPYVAAGVLREGRVRSTGLCSSTRRLVRRMSRWQGIAKTMQLGFSTLRWVVVPPQLVTVSVRRIHMNKPVALIVGAGPGISGAFAEALVAADYQVAVAARNLGKLQPLAAAIGATAFEVDASTPASIVGLFRTVDLALGAPDVVLYNPSARIRGDLLSLDIQAATAAIHTTAVGALVTAQEAARRMLPRGTGSIFFTGATAGVKGFAKSSVFAMGKFALRGLAQSLARELSPAGIHVVHFVIDGGVTKPSDTLGEFTPQAIARSYMAALAQPKGAWSWEVELRSHKEPF